MTKKQKKMSARILFSAAGLAALTFADTDGLLRFFLYLIPYFIIGYDILFDAVFGILNGRIFDENFLMAVATVGALALGLSGNGNYTEAVAVMLLYQTGELFQGYAVGKSRKSISGLMDIRPDHANIENDGVLLSVDPSQVEPGSVITVHPGERIPIDGCVVCGSSSLDTRALTGESLPRDVAVGDEVFSGSINLIGVLKIMTAKRFDESTASRILELVENAASRKSKSENFISSFARIYTPVVCISALLLAALPPIISIALPNTSPMWSVWLYRALTFLVASCPCALVISIPLTFFAGIGGAGKAGILIKGASYLEALSKTSCVVFDKTGTLTEGSFKVTKLCPAGIPGEKLLEYAALAEYASSHPIAKSLMSEYGESVDTQRIGEITELAGKGVISSVDGRRIAVGNKRLMEHLGIKCADCVCHGTVVHVAADGDYAGYIVISDVPKVNAAEAVERLNELGIKETVMLTGDRKETADAIARDVGISKVYSELLPDGKVELTERLIEKAKRGSKVVFVGDGINDAPVLSRADIGIAMGGVGSEAAIEGADIVLMDDDPLKIPKAIRISKKCLAIVMQNTIFAITVKVCSLILVGTGLAGMWLAIFADVGVMILAILNATRALATKNT